MPMRPASGVASRITAAPVPRRAETVRARPVRSLLLLVSEIALCVAAVAVGSGTAFAQTIEPPSVSLPQDSPVCADTSVTEGVCIQLPPDQPLQKVDVFFLLDDTGSFEGVNAEVGTLFGLLVSDLESALPRVNFGFGVGRFEDYGGPGI